jgi:hypothetical protein
VLQRANGHDNARPFTLKRFNAVHLGTTAVYLIKGILPRGGLTVVWGPAKCGKSFWAFDAAMHIARGISYRGRRVQTGAVVYLALEGGEGFRRRIEAYRRSHDVENVPFYLITDRLDLIVQHQKLIDEIRAQLGTETLVLVVIDTLNRSLSGSESSDEDMSAYVQAADAVREALKCAVLIVHHCGVDGTRPRGHTSLTGAADAQLAVMLDGSGNVAVTVEWMKDGPEGDVILSSLEQVELGLDDDGELITSCVVVPMEGKPVKQTATRRLSDRQRLALAALDECLATSGMAAPASLLLPASTIVVPLSNWREELYTRSIVDRDAKNPREAFRQIRTSLQGRNLISIRSDLVWRVL